MAKKTPAEAGGSRGRESEAGNGMLGFAPEAHNPLQWRQFLNYVIACYRKIHITAFDPALPSEPRIHSHHAPKKWRLFSFMCSYSPTDMNSGKEFSQRCALRSGREAG
jgi:hypothetical protein